MGYPARLSLPTRSLRFLVVKIGLLFFLAFLLQKEEGVVVYGADKGGCYPAIFSFGTSLSDTGNAVRSSPLFFTGLLLPYGETYFGHAAGRYTDGRVSLDLLAQSLGLPLLQPYLAYKGRHGADFSNGVNYAVSGATAEGPGFFVRRGGFTFLTTDSLDVQLKWHFGIQDMAEGRSPNSYPQVKLPDPAVFPKALYFIEMGGNDYGTLFFSKHLLNRNSKPITIDDAGTIIPAVIKKNLDTIEALYSRGGRNFFLFAQAPEGCAPLYLRYLKGTKDSDGCLDAFNQVDRLHNNQLLEMAQALKAKYPDIHITFADTYKAYMDVIRNPSSLGFDYVKEACCGAGPTKPFGFLLTRICSPITYKCSEPSKYLSWDGIHTTEAFNKYLINSLISGKYVVPVDGISSCASPIQ